MYRIILSTLLALALFAHGNAEHRVLVTVAPHKFFVEKIGGETIAVQLMVPAGASSHTYEPSAREIMRAHKGEIWFCIGEPFEQRALRALKSHQPNLKVVDLKQDVDLIPVKNGCHCCAGAFDLHFWMSPRQAIAQARTIARTLSEAYPESKELYQTNLVKFEEELNALDAQIRTILSPLKNRTILVSHPAYAYFCRDYQLSQLQIEIEGKEPTPQQITQLLCTARSLHITSIFVQPQYPNKAAGLIAETLGARLITLDPYSESYPTALMEIARAFANQQ